MAFHQPAAAAASSCWRSRPTSGFVVFLSLSLSFFIALFCTDFINFPDHKMGEMTLLAQNTRRRVVCIEWCQTRERKKSISTRLALSDCASVAVYNNIEVQKHDFQNGTNSIVAGGGHWQWDDVHCTLNECLFRSNRLSETKHLCRI